MAERAFITPVVLKWARESAGIGIDFAAAKVSVSAEKLKEWEEGKSQPTIRQAQILARTFKRPFAVLFLPEVPRDFQPLKDFRKPGSVPLTTSSIFMIREIQQKQAWLREFYSDRKEAQSPFVGRYTVKNSPDTVAADILQILNIKPGHYHTDNPVREWIDAAERNGIFISRTSFIHSHLKISSEELQGFSIADPCAPFIFINSDDWKAPQLFTLVHELAHIWIAETGISNQIEPALEPKESLDPVEWFCNKVAVAALMPAGLVLSLSPVVFQTSANVFKASGQFAVSSFALLIRALELGIITLPRYQDLKGQAEIDYAEFQKRLAERAALQKEKSSGPDYFMLQLNRNSRLFTQTVLDAYYGGTIEPVQASRLLNVQVDKFNRLEVQLYSTI